MNSPILKLIACLGLMMAFSGCSNQPLRTSSPEPVAANRVLEVHCEPVTAAQPGAQTCVEYVREGEPESYYHDEPNGFSSVFGYVVFRVVVESLIHALIYHR